MRVDVRRCQHTQVKGAWTKEVHSQSLSDAIVLLHALVETFELHMTPSDRACRYNIHLRLQSPSFESR